MKENSSLKALKPLGLSLKIMMENTFWIFHLKLSKDAITSWIYIRVHLGNCKQVESSVPEIFIHR